jgi:hypothetical protein
MYTKKSECQPFKMCFRVVLWIKLQFLFCDAPNQYPQSSIPVLQVPLEGSRHQAVLTIQEIVAAHLLPDGRSNGTHKRHQSIRSTDRFVLGALQGYPSGGKEKDAHVCSTSHR